MCLHGYTLDLVVQFWKWWKRFFKFGKMIRSNPAKCACQSYVEDSVQGPQSFLEFLWGGPVGFPVKFVKHQ